MNRLRTTGKRDGAGAAVPSSLEGTSLERADSDLDLLLGLDVLEVASVAANLACLRSESGSRTPFCGLTRRRFGQHLVDPAREGRLGDAGGQVAEEGRMDILLERKSFSLGNNKDSVDEAAEASRAPNKEDG